MLSEAKKPGLWASLPLETMVAILSHLPIRTTLKLSRVSKHWQIVIDNFAWLIYKQTWQFECDPFCVIESVITPQSLAPLHFTDFIRNLLCCKCKCGAFAEYIDTITYKSQCYLCCVVKEDLKMTHRKKSSSSTSTNSSSSADMIRSLSARSNSFGVVPVANKKHDTSGTPVVRFTNLQFASAHPQIVVNTSTANSIDVGDWSQLAFPLLTNSLDNAIANHQPGWTIQITRNSVINATTQGFEFGETCWVIGESVEAYLARSGKCVDTYVPTPTITVTENSAFINTAPLSLHNLHIISGRASSQASFSGLTVENLIYIDNCTIESHQGSGIVADSALADCILINCIFKPKFFACYCRGSILHWKSCTGNVFEMNQSDAIGCGQDRIAERFKSPLSKEWIAGLVKGGRNTFDESIEWPEYD